MRTPWKTSLDELFTGKGLCRLCSKARGTSTLNKGDYISPTPFSDRSGTNVYVQQYHLNRNHGAFAQATNEAAGGFISFPSNITDAFECRKSTE